MHSSRMRTVRSSGRISEWGGGTWSGGCLLRGGVYLVPGVLGGVPGPGGVYLVRGWWCLLGGVYLVPGGVYLVWGWVSALGGCTWSGTPPVDRHTPVKTQPSQLRCGR